MPLNKSRAYELMKSRGVDAIIASSLENVYYVSDYWSLALQLQCGGQAYGLLPLNDEPSLIAPISEADLVLDSGTWIKDVCFYGQPNLKIPGSDTGSEETRRLAKFYAEAGRGDDPIEALLKKISDKGLDKGALAVDATGTPRFHEMIKNRLPDAKIVDGSGLLKEIRRIKTKEEIEVIERATEITEKSMEDALEIARSEITELDLASMFEYSVAYDGGKVTYNLIGFRERSAYPNPIPSTFEAQRGDLIRLTLGCSWGHYHSNISRTAVIGSPEPIAKKRWGIVLKAQEKVLEKVKPGVQFSELYTAAEKELGSGGFKPPYMSFGHGIGIECNEKPLIVKGCEDQLEEGMVLNIDIPFLELGVGGVQVEDTIVVTEKGYKLLTKTDRSLYIL